MGGLLIMASDSGRKYIYMVQSPHAIHLIQFNSFILLLITALADLLD